MVGRWISFWEGLFSGAVLVLWRVYSLKPWIFSPRKVIAEPVVFLCLKSNCLFFSLQYMLSINSYCSSHGCGPKMVDLEYLSWYPTLEAKLNEMGVCSTIQGSKWSRQLCIPDLLDDTYIFIYIQRVWKIVVLLDRSFATNNKPLRTPSVFTKPIQEQFDMIQPVPVNVVIEYRFLWLGPTKGNDSMTWTCLRWFVTQKVPAVFHLAIL